MARCHKGDNLSVLDHAQDLMSRDIMVTVTEQYQIRFVLPIPAAQFFADVTALKDAMVEAILNLCYWMRCNTGS